MSELGFALNHMAEPHVPPPQLIETAEARAIRCALIFKCGYLYLHGAAAS